MCIQIFCPLIRFFFPLSCIISLYISDIDVLSNIWFANIFPIHFVDSFLCCENVLAWCSSLCLFCFCYIRFVCQIYKSPPRLMSRNFFVCLLIWPHHIPCEILFPWPGIHPRLLLVRVQGPNHWTTREFPLGGLMSMFSTGFYGFMCYIEFFNPFRFNCCVWCKRVV